MRIEQRDLTPTERQAGRFYLERMFDHFLRQPMCTWEFEWQSRELLCRCMQAVAYGPDDRLYEYMKYV